jgi:hypothetical protein
MLRRITAQAMIRRVRIGLEPSREDVRTLMGEPVSCRLQDIRLPPLWKCTCELQLERIPVEPAGRPPIPG